MCSRGQPRNSQKERKGPTDLELSVGPVVSEPCSPRNATALRHKPRHFDIILALRLRLLAAQWLERGQPVFLRLAFLLLQHHQRASRLLVVRMRERLRHLLEHWLRAPFCQLRLWHLQKVLFRLQLVVVHAFHAHLPDQMVLPYRPFHPTHSTGPMPPIPPGPIIPPGIWPPPSAG